MTTATVTYHKLPPLTGWTTNDPLHASSQMRNQPTTVQQGYVRQDVADDEVKWSHYLRQEQFPEQFVASNTQGQTRKARGLKCRAPALAVPGEELCLDFSVARSLDKPSTIASSVRVVTLTCTCDENASTAASRNACESE
ncbi:hypothetical protein TELCIR_06042 [Teladorsagia circumcincta]|uniref:Uncharacterized protein n=1 Tax=Teladorsagia circumcincta TaxID=45464 RepID=A0A2G9UP62_TELCI|nr:hypothetical protein TELCIR_06042 [Teladorsagia circumcincta]